MTDIQRAYNTGRHAGYELGGTGCHSYVELRTPCLDRARLETAWHALIQRHDLLSAVVVAPDMLQVVPFESSVRPGSGRCPGILYFLDSISHFLDWLYS